VTPVEIGAIVGLVVGVALGFHGGSGAAHYRHFRNGCAAGRGHRRPSVWACLGRGAFVWLSVPVGAGFRLGHRL
jgi:hypothetical protein